METRQSTITESRPVRTFQRQPSRIAQTSFLGGGIYTAVFTAMTGAAAVQAEPIHQSVMDLARRDQDARAHFLAKKFAGESSLEDDARFHLLTQKLQQLVPRVSAADIDRLGEDIALVESTVDFLAKLDAELDGD